MSEVKRFSILEYINGIYQGDLRQNFIREGLGVYLWDSGEFYYGEWRDDHMDGEGVLYFPYGGFIRGTFRKNKINGQGVLKFPNGDIYKAMWKEGKLNGDCEKYFRDNQTKLVCEYRSGVFYKNRSQGKGNQALYESVESEIQKLEALEKKHSIEGKYNFGYNYKCVRFPDNGKFFGIVKNDIPNGLGIFHYNDGKMDQGFYKNGLLEGFGRLNFQNGDIYDGMMKQGMFEGFGMFYKKSLNKWVYGNYQSNVCKKIIEIGLDQPKNNMETLKSEQHRTSDYFQEKVTKCNVFEIPQLSENRCSVPQRLSTSSSKKKSSPKTRCSVEPIKRKSSVMKSPPNPNPPKKAPKFQSVSVSTEEIQTASHFTQAKPEMVDSSTQTAEVEDVPIDEPSENFEPSQEPSKTTIFEEKKDVTLQNEEPQKTMLGSNSITSEVENSTMDKKRLTKLEIENLFKSVKNMIIGVKEKDSVIQEKSRMSSFQSSFLSKHLDIQNLKDSTDQLIQKLENIKRSRDEGNLKQSLQSSDFMLSRSETFSSFEGNNFTNNLPQKASNILESKLLESIVSNGNPNPNEFNITKSIDFLEKMLGSQVMGNGLANKESKISNNIGLSNIENTDEQNFYSDNENDCDLFHSHFLSSCKNIYEDPNNNTNAVPIYYIGSQKYSESVFSNKDKIMIFDQENGMKNNHEIMVKYGSGIEKIEEKAEEITNSPNSKNNLLKFNSKKATPNSAKSNILRERTNIMTNGDSSKSNTQILQDDSDQN